MLDFILLVIGITGLWGGTVLTLSGAVALSDRSGLSQGFVGLTVLAIGTDLPELFVSVSGSLQQLRGVDASGVIVGNAIGSAIAQGTLVLGIAGLFGYLTAAPRIVRRDGATLLLAIVLTLALAYDGSVGRLEGAALLSAYLIFFVALFQAEHRHAEPKKSTDSSLLRDLATVAIGVTTVTLAAHVVVTESLEIANAWGVSQTLLGVLVLGLGTSLPELILSVGAATKGHASLSLGNVIGSNIFDLLVPIGVGAVIHPLAVADATISFDLPALGLATLALLIFLSRKRGLQRQEAIALIALFVGYAALRVAIG